MKAAICSVAMLGLLSAPLSSAAQSKLYLDLRAGVNRNDAEGAYFG